MPLKLSAKTLHGFLIAALLAITVLIYAPGLNGPFLLDDHESINPAKMPSFSWSQLTAISLANKTGPMGRPITIASFALTHLFFGDDPYAYKAVNLGLHLLTGLLLLLLFTQISTLLEKSPSLGFRIGFVTAMLWLLHPVQISTVLYAVQRMTALSTFFMCLGLLSYLKGRLRFNEQQRYGMTLMILSYALFFPLALLSKETGVLFPFYVFIIEWFVLRFTAPTLKDVYAIKRFQVGLCLIVIFGATLYYWKHVSYFLERFAEQNISIVERLITESTVFWMYIKMLVFPSLSDLGLYQDDIQAIKHLTYPVIFALTGIVALVVVMVKTRKTQPALALGIGWFFVSQGIESTIIPLELMFEHRVYLGSIGIMFIISTYFWKLLEHLRTIVKGTILIASACILGLFLYITHMRVDGWSTADNFLKMEALYHPLSPRVHIELANWLLSQKENIMALDALDNAQILQPHNAGIALHQLLIYCQATHTPAIRYEYTAEILRSSAITPYVIKVFDGIVSNMFHQKCPGLDKDEVIKLLDIALSNPFLKHKPLYRATLFHLKAGIVLSQEKLQDSLILLHQSYEAYPQRISPLIEKANLELSANMISQAQETIYTIHTHAVGLLPEQEQIRALDKALKKMLDKEQSAHP